jgi:predicted transcriptional regulator
MILSDEEVFERLNSNSNVSVLKMRQGAGRTSGANGLEVESKTLIASLVSAGSGESQASVAETFNVSPSAVSKMSRGLKTDNESLDSGLSGRLKEINRVAGINEKVEKAHEGAIDVLSNVLDSLRSKIPEVTKARELSKIASDMSRVASSFSSGGGLFGGLGGINGNGNKVQVIVHAPSMKHEDDFETIVVK